MQEKIKHFVWNKLEKLVESYLEKHVYKYISQALSQEYFDQRIKEIILKDYLIFGDAHKLEISPNSIVNNALFNLSSGKIIIGDYVFFGHNVSLITGTHNYQKFGLERMEDFPKEGNDIVIEEGVWIASNVTVIGPCIIGKHSVVGAGSVVKGDIPSYHVVAGIPAKTIKEIK